MMKILTSPFVLVIAFALILIFYLKPATKSKDEIDSETFEQKVKDALARAGKNIKQLSYNPEWYQEKAQALYVAMKGAGTDESAILKVVKLLKIREDFDALKLAFGVRLYNTEWYEGEKKSGTLEQWLLWEFEKSDKDFQKIEEHLMTIQVTL